MFRPLFTLILLVALSSSVWAQRSPSIGYVFPAGAQQGATIQVQLAGQYLDGVSGIDISGNGITGTVVEHVKPLNGKQINLLRDRQRALQAGLSAAKKGEAKVAVRNEIHTNQVDRLDRAAVQKEIAEIKTQLANPKNRNRENPQLSEDVTLRLSVAADAKPGIRELRLRTPTGLSRPVAFHVGGLPEVSEKEPNDQTATTALLTEFPLVLNGQVMPGDGDRFRLKLRAGTRLVAAVSARQLIPYLADAVPGWFQATLGLYDGQGNEVAYADDFRFHPDPVLYYEIPHDGEYVIEIKDAIYRGREDFVYRIAVGELPFVTSIFPLGGRQGTAPAIEVRGWNLPTDELVADTSECGVHKISLATGKCTANIVPFAVDDLPETREQEPNNESGAAQSIHAPVIVNGRIDRPGDWDVFRFTGKAAEVVVVEVQARRLNSPLDSMLKLTDAQGHAVALNDDHEDKGAGLTTHHADSYLSVELPQDGTYYLFLGDAQQAGGAAYGYRLRLSPPRPDFELRMTPSTLNARAGASIPITVYALRKDGFVGEINLALQNAPAGFSLSGSRIPANQDQAKLTLRVPPTPTKAPVSLHLEGQAAVQGRAVQRTAVPAEDMMQAFIYRHLVPVQECKVTVFGRARQNNASNRPVAAAKPKNK